MPHWHMLLLRQHMRLFPNVRLFFVEIPDADKGRGFDGEGCASLKPVMNVMV